MTTVDPRDLKPGDRVWYQYRGDPEKLWHAGNFRRYVAYVEVDTAHIDAAMLLPDWVDFMRDEPPNPRWSYPVPRRDGRGLRKPLPLMPTRAEWDQAAEASRLIAEARRKPPGKWSFTVTDTKAGT
jgi:hypothetical protein